MKGAIKSTPIHRLSTPYLSLSSHRGTLGLLLLYYLRGCWWWNVLSSSEMLLRITFWCDRKEGLKSRCSGSGRKLPDYGYVVTLML